ncbi:MAG: hypothetical protein JXB17_07910 [Bacteroidales bacterium]|nr:hypothetical protein [Bacteroidales bacterium]
MKKLTLLALAITLIQSCNNNQREKEDNKEIDYFSLITDKIWVDEDDDYKFQYYYSSKDSIEYIWRVSDLWNDEMFPFVPAKGTPYTHTFNEDSDADYVEGWIKSSYFEIEGNKITLKHIKGELIDNSDHQLTKEQIKESNKMIKEVNELLSDDSELFLNCSDTIIDDIKYYKLNVIEKNGNKSIMISKK